MQGGRWNVFFCYCSEMEEAWARGERRRSGRIGSRWLWSHCLCCCALLFLLVTLQVIVLSSPDSLSEQWLYLLPIIIGLSAYGVIASADSDVASLIKPHYYLVRVQYTNVLEKLTRSRSIHRKLQVVVELGQIEMRGDDLRNDRMEDWTQVKETNNLQSRAKKDSNMAMECPIILWWSPLTGELGRLGQCGADTCFFTVNRTYRDHHMTRAFLFYGTDFQIDSLPLPRKPQHEWALFHEESPKNNYKLFHEPTVTLFNYTSTFSRNSHLPLTTQYLESIEELKSHKYMLPLSEKNRLRDHLAPLVYVQSDCDPPSDRDTYVRELMKYIQVDSYGECLHNKDLPTSLKDPTTMDHEAFYWILAQYKFILAFENAVCDDYITEKLWRPFKLGAVPVYYGSPSVADWLPSNNSAILVGSFSHPKKLADYIMQLDSDDQRYEVFLEWKRKGPISNEKLVTAMKERKWGVQDVSQDNYIDAFECLVCNGVWDNLRRKQKGLSPIQWQGQADHLSCPGPKAFAFLPSSLGGSVVRDLWMSSFDQSKREAAALRHLVELNQNFTVETFWKMVLSD